MDSSSRALPDASLAEVFPALLGLAGPERFARLERRALALAEKTGKPPGALLQTVIARLAVRLDLSRTDVPSRLLTDLAALEWAIEEVSRDPDPEVRVEPLRRDEVPLELAGVVVVPIPALRLVSVAFRLDAYIRRIRRGRRPPPPERGDQTIAVYRPRAHTHRLVLSRGEGRLLSLIIVGTSLDVATATAVERQWLPDAETTRDRLAFWVGEGLFTSVMLR